MQHFQRPDRRSLIRRVVTPMFAVAALAMTAQAALATPKHRQPKPEFKVEAERTAQGAKLLFKGKGWAPSAKVKITGTRAPGTVAPQDFGTFDVDAEGVLNARKTVQCSTQIMEDAQNESVEVTAYDLATPAVKFKAKVAGGAWVCY
jgi:hypothetical protein